MGERIHHHTSMPMYVALAHTLLWNSLSEAFHWLALLIDVLEWDTSSWFQWSSPYNIIKALINFI